MYACISLPPSLYKTLKFNRLQKSSFFVSPGCASETRNKSFSGNYWYAVFMYHIKVS